jgi:hypothetical protein
MVLAVLVMWIFHSFAGKALFSKFRDCLFSLRAVGPISLDTAQILNDLSYYIGFDDQDLISDGVRAVSNILPSFVPWVVSCDFLDRGSTDSTLQIYIFPKSSSDEFWYRGSYGDT